jgi:hypothetical protein
MNRASDNVKEVSPLVKYGIDMKSAAAAIKAAEVSVEREPRAVDHAGMIVGFAADPGRNRIELI